MVSRLEALLDALSDLKGYGNPDSILYSIRNPLGVQSFSRPGKNEITESGIRIFSSDLAGRRACLFDLDLKIKGESRAGIKREDALSNLLRVFQITERLGMQKVVRFLRRALKDESITTETPLAYFRNEEIN